MARFKDRSLQRCYAATREVARDLASELYCSPLGPEGPRCPRLGAGHRDYYWKGRAGITGVTVRGSLAHACWVAGQDDAKAFGAIHPRWLSVGIPGAGLSTKDQIRAFIAEPASALPWETPR